MRAHRYLSITDRFWLNVEKTDSCWNWTAHTSGGGVAGRYGAFTGPEGKKVYVHRYSYSLHFGPIPDGLFVLHRCDNRRCVNPDHLWLGTHDDNMADMLAKGRHWTHRGEAQYKASLTDVQAEEILLRLSGNPPRGTAQALALEYGVSHKLISEIKVGRTYRHVLPDLARVGRRC